MLKYVTLSRGNLHRGTTKKARYQVAALNELGIASELLIVTQKQGKEEVFEQVKFFYVETVERKNILSRLDRAKKIRGIISDIITSLNPEDILYIRGLEFQLLYYPLAFFKPFRKCKLISEHQSIEIKQSLLYNSYSSVIIDLLLGNILVGQSDGIVGVTDQITAFWSKRLFYRKIPCITIPNGFHVRSVNVRNPPLFNSRDIHVLFVGNVSRWHGVDRMIRGIAEYRGPARIHFHIVGDGDEIENLKQLKNTLTPEADIHFHGFLKGHDLDTMFDTSHIAVGSLGIHRKGLSQTSELKAREYCSRGIPYVIACGDSDFPDQFPYILRIPADENPVNIEDVVSFMHKLSNNPDHHHAMRTYAEENLDWKVKGAKLKGFIDKNFCRLPSTVHRR